ncbi:large ribosomal subunit protein bL35m [Rhinophrynus dorsalis]
MAATSARLGQLTRHFSGLSIRAESRKAAVLRPVLNTNIRCSIRSISGLCTLISRPTQGLPVRSKLAPSTGNVTATVDTSILNRIAPLLPSLLHQPVRSVTYCSVRSGKRKTVKSVVDRFLRLHCGLWVRRKAGYKKKLWKKSAARKKRLREHVFCNKTQCKLLDKMTTSFWKRRNWYINDPYQKYHDRTNLKV